MAEINGFGEFVARILPEKKMTQRERKLLFVHVYQNEYFVHYAITGKSPFAVIMDASYDNVDVIQYEGELYIPASWVRSELGHKSEVAEWLDKMDNIAAKVRAEDSVGA
jgi:hypothetical protein